MESIALADWLKRLAPRDLGGAFYVVSTDELDETRGGKLPYAGFTVQFCDQLFQDVIEKRGDWRGRGACIVVNPIVADGFDPGGDMYHSRLRTIGIHELAHVLEREVMLANLNGDHIKASRLVAELQRIHHEFEVAACIPECSNPRIRATHDAQFARIGTHLHDRAMRLGERGLCGKEVTAGYSRPRYSGIRAYRAALGDELERFADATFAEIRAEPIPPAFAALVEADTGGTQ
jgi:hypothetical protein